MRKRASKAVSVKYEKRVGEQFNLEIPEYLFKIVRSSCCLYQLFEKFGRSICGNV